MGRTPGHLSNRVTDAKEFNKKKKKEEEGRTSVADSI